MDETRARTNEPIDTPKNFTDTEIDMSQGDAIIINDDDNDELLPQPDDFCYHRLSLLPSSNTASCDFLCYQRFQLLSSSSSTTVVFYSNGFPATIVCHCCHHLTLLRVTFVSAVNVSNCCHRLLLLPSSNIASCDFICCQRFQLLSSSSSSTATVVFYYSSDFCYHRLSLLPSSNTASCDFLCCRRFLLPPSSSTVAVTCYHRATSFTVVVFLCCRPHDDFERNNFCHL
ncbi:hypothetical protein CEXT_784601 [Caerostris extrusa]|uniref:C-CAP/cofactor C-like domain-containing protein n=1 Tax=Caerostris extrusa TaxID=172846 RepID=A0AAV4R1B5_CAEEX|nr:hypothetical protein CEXT_784601 [Caerostris extrusa]